MALPRILQIVAGRIRQILPIQTSAGAADAEKIPATNAQGVLDPTLLNAATTGANKVALLDGSGRLDPSTMPSGFGQDAKTIQASEALAAGDLVNIWDNSGARARKADATAEGKEVHGFVLAGVASGGQALVLFEGGVTGQTGLTPGARYYLSATTPGRVTATPPAASGNVVQYVGVAVSATEINFEADDAITVA